MSIEDLLPADTPAPPSGAWAATVLEAPGGPGDDITVTIDDLGPRHRFGPMPWMPRGDDLPSEGDDALVIFDNDGNGWVVAWRPV